MHLSAHLNELADGFKDVFGAGRGTKKEEAAAKPTFSKRLLTISGDEFYLRYTIDKKGEEQVTISRTGTPGKRDYIAVIPAQTLLKLQPPYFLPGVGATGYRFNKQQMQDILDWLDDIRNEALT
jgi:hypothetical protein